MSQFPEKKKITSEDNSVTTSGRAIPVGAHELRVVETSAILDVGGVHTHIHTHKHTVHKDPEDSHVCLCRRV